MRILILVSMLALLPAMARAQASRPPFPAFTVLDPAGNAVSSATLVAGRPTVLAVVRPSCGRCDQLLNALARLQEAGAIGGALVILVESPPDEAAAFAARKIPPALSGVPWFADTGREARAALELKGTPALFGIERSSIAWSYAGTPERSLLESLLRTWNRAGASR